MCSGKSKYILFFGIVLLLSVSSCVERMEIDTGFKAPYVKCVLSRNDDVQKVQIFNMDDVDEVQIKVQSGASRPYSLHKVSDTSWEAWFTPAYGTTYILNVIRSGKDTISATTTYPPESHVRAMRLYKVVNPDECPDGSTGRYALDLGKERGLKDLYEIYPNQYFFYMTPNVESLWWVHFPDLSDLASDADFCDNFNVNGNLSDGTPLHYRYLRMHNLENYDNGRKGYAIFLSMDRSGRGFCYNPNSLFPDSGYVRDDMMSDIDDMCRERLFSRRLFNVRNRSGKDQLPIFNVVSREMDLYYQSVLRYKLIDRTDVLNNMYPEDNELYSNVDKAYGIFGAQETIPAKTFLGELEPFPFPGEEELWKPYAL